MGRALITAGSLLAVLGLLVSIGRRLPMRSAGSLATFSSGVFGDVAVPALTLAVTRQFNCMVVRITMELRKTIADLQQEKARLDRVIASLEQLANVSSTVAPVVSRRGRRFMGAQEREVVSERMRKYWAARRASQMERGIRTEHVQTMTSASAA